MRMRPAADDLLERVALGLNLAPLPAAYAMYGMLAGRVVGVAQRVGVFSALLAGPARAVVLAEQLGLQEPGTRLLCENLAGLGILELRGQRFALSRRSRRWLDPGSPTYVGTWLEHSLTYWEWWGDLERIVRDGSGFEIHSHDPDDHEYWHLYITGQYELARLSAAEVARTVALPSGASSLLDVAGGHGWFAATLCAAHPGLHATVIDLPGSARVGRRIIAEAGMSGAVEHRDGDMFAADLGGPHDAVLLFDIVHHLPAERVAELLGRIRAAMRPGATIAVLDMFRSGDSGQRASAAALGMFFHLTSGADLHSRERIGELLRAAGFSDARVTRIRRLPDQLLLQASAV